MICHVQKQGLVEIKYGKTNIYIYILACFVASTGQDIGKIKIPIFEAQIKFKKHFSWLFVPEFKNLLKCC